MRGTSWLKDLRKPIKIDNNIYYVSTGFHSNEMTK